MGKVPRRPMYANPFDVEIREPTAADADAAARMHLTAWREAYTPLLPTAFWSEGIDLRWQERWRRNLAAPEPDLTSRIAVRDGSVVGLASAGSARENATAGAPVRDRELWALYVLAAEYGTGLADRLLTAVLPDDVPAELWVFEANPRARAFYARHGFTPDGARHVFGPDLGNQPEIRLVR